MIQRQRAHAKGRPQDQQKGPMRELRLVWHLVGMRQPASTKTTVPQHGHVAACQHVNMTTCERALQSSCQAAPASPVKSLVTTFSVLSLSCSSSFFYCLLVVLLKVFIGRGCQPISSRAPPFVVLSFSCPLFLFSSCSPASVLPSCCCVVFWRCPVVACPFFVLFGVFVAFLPSSFCPLLFSSCPPLVFLLSCCCRAVHIAFRGRGWGCGRPPLQPAFGRAVWAAARRARPQTAQSPRSPTRRARAPPGGP